MILYVLKKERIYKTSGGIPMPWYSFSEIWTPLSMFGVKLYREKNERKLWVKVGNKKRRRLFGHKDHRMEE